MNTGTYKHNFNYLDQSFEVVENIASILLMKFTGLAIYYLVMDKCIL